MKINSSPNSMQLGHCHIERLEGTRTMMCLNYPILERRLGFRKLGPSLKQHVWLNVPHVILT